MAKFCKTRPLFTIDDDDSCEQRILRLHLGGRIDPVEQGMVFGIDDAHAPDVTATVALHPADAEGSH